MKAVILDKATIGNDVSLQSIEDLCELKTYETTETDEIIERIQDAEIIISNKVIIGKDEMNIARNLKLVCVAATGYNNIDIDEARKRNIVVANVRGYSTESVAQTVFGFILTIMNSVIENSADIKNGKWQKSPVFTILDHPFVELKGKTLGIIGYGTIGKRVSEIAKVFGMKILLAESIRSNKKDSSRTPIDTLLKESDIISIHTPLTKDTENLITLSELKLMKKSAILINTARGGIVNENDLYTALKKGLIRYAATDVLTKEPPGEGNILFDAPNMVITPHIAWTSFEARKKLVSGIAENIRAYLSGNSDSINLC